MPLKDLETKIVYCPPKKTFRVIITGRPVLVRKDPPSKRTKYVFAPGQPKTGFKFFDEAELFMDGFDVFDQYNWAGGMEGSRFVNGKGMYEVWRKSNGLIYVEIDRKIAGRTSLYLKTALVLKVLK